MTARSTWEADRRAPPFCNGESGNAFASVQYGNIPSGNTVDALFRPDNPQDAFQDPARCQKIFHPPTELRERRGDVSTVRYTVTGCDRTSIPRVVAEREGVVINLGMKGHETDPDVYRDHVN